MAKYLSVEKSAGISTIMLDNPDSEVNIVSSPWIAEMFAAVEAARDDPEVKGIILASARPAFMAGADLNALYEAALRMTAVEAFRFSQTATRLHRLIETCGKPVCAAISTKQVGLVTLISVS